MATDAKGNTRTLKEEAQLLYSPIPTDTWAWFNEMQLWYIFLGLSRLALEDSLNRGTRHMADGVAEYGRTHYGWTV